MAYPHPASLLSKLSAGHSWPLFAFQLAWKERRGRMMQEPCLLIGSHWAGNQEKLPFYPPLWCPGLLKASPGLQLQAGLEVGPTFWQVRTTGIMGSARGLNYVPSCVLPTEANSNCGKTVSEMFHLTGVPTSRNLRLLSATAKDRRKICGSLWSHLVQSLHLSWETQLHTSGQS